MVAPGPFAKALSKVAADARSNHRVTMVGCRISASVLARAREHKAPRTSGSRNPSDSTSVALLNEGRTKSASL
jgi:hypothetical protein